MVLKRKIEKKFKNKKINWSLAEIDRMINAFTENQHSTISTYLTRETYRRIADYMIEEGFPSRTPQQIRSKWFQLKSAYIGYYKIPSHPITRKIPEVFRRKIAEYIQNEKRIEQYQNNFGIAATLEYFKGGKNLIGALKDNNGNNKNIGNNSYNDNNNRDETFGCCGSDNMKKSLNSQKKIKMAAGKGVVGANNREDNEAIFDYDDDDDNDNNDMNEEEAIFDLNDEDTLMQLNETDVDDDDDDNEDDDNDNEDDNNNASNHHNDDSDPVVVNNSLTCCLTFHDSTQNRTLILPADDLFYVRNRRQFVLNLENDRFNMWRTFMQSVSKF